MATSPCDCDAHERWLIAAQRRQIDKLMPHPRTLMDPQTKEVIAIAVGYLWARCDGRDPGDEDPIR